MKDIDIFNKIKQHMLTQNEKSLTFDGGCAYRGIKQSDLNEAWEKKYKTECPYNIGKINIYDSGVNEALENLLLEVPNNLMCAVGVIVSDEHYDRDMEENSINSNLVSVPVKLSNPDWKITCQSWAMLEVLQSIHDAELVENWATRLESFIFDDLGNFVDADE